MVAVAMTLSRKSPTVIHALMIHVLMVSSRTQTMIKIPADNSMTAPMHNAPVTIGKRTATMEMIIAW